MRTFPPRGWIEPSGVGRARWLALLLLVLLPAVARSLDWTAPVEGVRSAPLPVTTPGGGPGFTLLDPSRTRIEFSNRLGIDRSVTNQILLNGSGVAAGDIDGDGWCDLYFCAIDGSNALFRNLGGWRFEEITERAGVACRDLQSTGAVLADLDGDGDLDLLVNTVGHGTRIFLNDGRGHFTPGATLNEGRAGMSMALGDLDGDGNLDLYIANYRVTTLRDMPHTGFKLRKIEGGGLAVAFVNGRPVSDPDLEGRFVIAPGGRIVERGEVDAVYRGDGHGGFTPVPFLGGRFLDEEGHPLTEAPHDWGLSVVMRDLNQDGAPDLYVCNDFDSVDRFWLNDGKGGFRAAPRLALRSTSRFSMGVDVADINRDGWDDLLVLDMLSPDHVTRLTRGDGAWFDPAGGGRIDSRPQVPRNTLQLARGDGTYAEISQYAGLDATGWSWTPMFLDVDLDGYEDLLVTAGHARDDTDLDTAARIERMKRAGGLTPSQELELRRASPRLELPRMAFRNLGNLRFAAMSAAWHFDQVGVGHGMCAADLDNDGDLDVVVNNLNAPAGIYRNEAAAARVAVRLRGLGGNTRGIGARITLRQGAVPIQSQELQAGGRYLSGDDSMRVFAASGAGGPMALEVRWRSGRVSRVEGVLANRLYEVSESSGSMPERFPTRPRPTPWFSEVQGMAPGGEPAPSLEDGDRQPLIPRRLAQPGPAVAWIDVDGDGRDELWVGAFKGARLTGYRAVAGVSGGVRFEPLVAGDAVTPEAHDMSGLVAVHQATGGVQLLAGVSTYEEGGTNGPAVVRHKLQGAQAGELLPGWGASVGPLAMADIDGDGDLDLFVAGRVIPGRYPEAASSRVYENRAGTWVLSDENSRRLERAGLVSGALWTDLDGDGFPELVLACEWGPLKVFHNERGRLVEATSEWGLERELGWWNGVAAGDFDGDGRIDLVGCNWGTNTRYRASEARPRRLLFGDIAGSGGVDLVEAYQAGTAGEWVPERDLAAMERVFPFLRERYALHRRYAEATLGEILGSRIDGTRHLEATRLETTLYLNRGGRFERTELPAAAQFSPAMAACVADFDGDGREDLFLSQNLFSLPQQTPRADAGRGLLLRGEGQGGFTEVGREEGGIEIYGEQRGCAAGDFDGDGRVDLAVAQHGAATRVFRNLGGTVGLRVRARAGEGNPDGIGARLRLEFGSGWGPVREIRAGSGSGSQDSPVQVLGTPSTPRRIEVLWPGGKRTVSELPPGVREITVEPAAGLRVLR